MEHAPNAADRQMAVQQSQANEQLEALNTECDRLRVAVDKAVADRDHARRANVLLWMQSLQDKANSTTESNALRAQCMKAEAEVAKLQGENEIFKQMSEEQEDTTATSAALRPLSFPTLSRIERGLVTQASPQLGEGMRGLGMPRASPLPSVGHIWLGLSWDQLVLPCFLPPGLDRERARRFHQARIWGRPT